MTDFETRARAAGRAIHDAVSAPADELTARRKGRGPVRALLIAAAVVVLAAVVGTTLVTRDEGAAPESDVTTFCAQLETMIMTPVDIAAGSAEARIQQGRSLEFLRDAPEEIRATALEILQASKTADGRVPDVVSQRFAQWWQLRCYPDAAAPGGGARNTRAAPAPVSAPFTVCSVANTLVPAATERLLTSRLGTMTIYGPTVEADPYAGPMVGVVTTSEQSFFDDDSARPIAVPGHPDASVSIMTGVRGAPLPNLGRMITWRTGEHFVAVMGRGYDEAAALATIASGVRTDAPIPVIDRSVLPNNFEPLFAGSVAQAYGLEAASASIDPTSTYSITMNDGNVVLNGAPDDRSAFEAIRFFAPALTRATVGGKESIVGDVEATNTAPATLRRIVRWRAGDVMLTMSIGKGATVSDADVAAFVAATRELNRAEWERLVGQATSCRSGEDMSSTGSGTSAATSSGSSSATTVAP